MSSSPPPAPWRKEKDDDAEFLSILEDFHRTVESYSSQHYAPYHIIDLQKNLVLRSLTQRSQYLREDILSRADHSPLQKLYHSWEEKYILSSIFKTNTPSFSTTPYYHHVVQKLPVGSNQVPMDLHNTRFLLSRVAWLLAQLSFHQQYQMKEYEQYLKESFIWYPKNAQVCYQLGELYKVTATNEERLQESEYFFRRAVQLGMILMSSSFSSNTILHPDGAIAEPKYHETEIIFAEKAGAALLLLLYQSYRYEEADEILRQSQKYSWKINENILSFQPSVENKKSEGTLTGIEDAKVNEFPVYYLEDNFLPPDLLSHLQEFFQNSSSFWLEHNYNYINNQSMISGYFSYVYPFRERNAICSIEQLIDKIYRRLLLIDDIFQEATVAEWWVHSRPHCSGHQLHYDSDETKIENGGLPNHPIASCVLYLSSSDIGGPTLVSDQILNQSMGTQAWLVPPKENRLLVFDAKYLHGVIPGVGIIPTGNVNDRRLTFMVGFWRSLEARDKGKDCIGAGQPYPDSRRAEPAYNHGDRPFIEVSAMQTSFSWTVKLFLHKEWTWESHPKDVLNKGKWKLENLSDFGIKRIAPFWKQVLPTNSRPQEEGRLPNRNEDYQKFYQGF